MINILSAKPSNSKGRLNQEFDEINKKVEGLINIIKNSYYE